MGDLLSTTRLTTAALTLVLLAVAYRIDPIRDAITGDEKFLGLF